ncbi:MULTISPECIES: SIMPL domain-containing protein [unclassified Paenibacillus]|uniref:SIMPL domain-containing protein n=1 Tax=unclassified Paenibacillus TaxID=185978 RepID=UPI001B6848BC|nr:MULTISPECIES: SIMPL domain-containing protein [unclassified Paenibacillus]MBP1155608.1 uncharacterized protein YggE [Paenibacillus sp. PvP091]MBP1169006.1 uncharacterized protein YggE [Paenibacillus sp. PvR098]MBP2440034.1 uncharacterized protein YggE [Paenibacillus sp. PvP052]
MYSNQPWYPSPLMAASSVHDTCHIIEVSGEGTVTAPPDRAIIELGVITENPSLTIAQKDNAAAIANIVHSLIQLNIPEEHIQTVSYRIEIQYHYADGKQIFRGYQVNHMLQITLSQVDQTGLVVDTAVNHGANTVSSIRFSIARPEIYYNHSLTLALKNAESKAMTIARTLGASLVRHPIKVLEETPTREPRPYQASLYAESATATPIQPGELKITAAIKVHYAYQ